MTRFARIYLALIDVETDAALVLAEVCNKRETYVAKADYRDNFLFAHSANTFLNSSTF